MSNLWFAMSIRNLETGLAISLNGYGNYFLPYMESLDKLNIIQSFKRVYKMVVIEQKQVKHFQTKQMYIYIYIYIFHILFLSFSSIFNIDKYKEISNNCNFILNKLRLKILELVNINKYLIKM